MFFSQEDYKKIQLWLQKNAIKDTEFNNGVLPLNGEETIALVQNKQNIKIFLKDFIAQLALLGSPDFINISDKFGENYISLSQAIKLIPYRSRKIGQVITFLDEFSEWRVYQFQGERVNQWNNTTLWIDLLQAISDSSNIVPDEEDITEVLQGGRNLLKFRDKNYNKDDYSGLGRVFLRKNLTTVTDPSTMCKISTNLLTQEMISREYTIYIIQYDYTLNGNTIVIPKGSILDFQGGSIDDGTLSFEDDTKIKEHFIGNATIEGNPYYIDYTPDEEDITIVKDVIKFKDKEYNPSEFSGLGRVYLRKNISNGKNILTQDMINKPNTRYIIQYDYDLNSTEITIPEGCVLDFQGGSLRNGVIIGNRTGIAGHPVYNIFNDTIIKGFNLSYLDIRWFGAVSDFISTDETGTDNSPFIRRALEASVNCAGVPILIEGRYRIGTTIETGYDINLIGRYNNNRTFITESDTYTDKVSLLYVDNCSAFKVIGRGLSTTKSANITVKNLYLRGSGTGSNSTFIEYSATGGPSRVGYISEVEVRGFNKFLYFYDDGSNPHGTLYGNLTIEKVVAYYNNQFIVAKASGDIIPTLCNLIIKDSNIEQNGARAIDLENLFGANIIDNCILEGQHYPIRAVITTGSLEITNNYFEVNEGEYLVNISGKSPSSCFVKYENNYKHSNVTSPLRFSRVSLTGFDSMNNNPSQLNFSNCIIACDVFPYLTTDSFTSILNFNEPRYCNAIDSDENIRLLSFGNKRIESNILGTIVNSDRLYSIARVTSLEVNEGDVLVIVFYKTSGSLQFGIYDSSGSPISSENGAVIAGTSRMIMLKMNINASSSGVYVYMQALSGGPCVGNGMIYKNPDAVSLHKLGIFPAGLLSNTISPINAKASDIEANYFINTDRGAKGLYYSDSTYIRNSDGAPFSKEEIVLDFIQYYSFLRENKTYKVVGDLDLNGTQVIVPEGCTIDFSRGGTISNGTFSLTNTRLLPQGLNLREYILEGVSITGTYKEGQIVYDSAIKKMKLWNGSAWVNMDGTSLDVSSLNSMEVIPASEDKIN